LQGIQRERGIRVKSQDQEEEEEEEGKSCVADGERVWLEEGVVLFGNRDGLEVQGIVVYESFKSNMGGGNAQKSKTARERNAEKAKQAAKGSQLDTNKKAMTIQCKTCMQTFMCTTSEVKCREHAEAKHPKVDVGVCFPHLMK
jgi:hypothetical protein